MKREPPRSLTGLDSPSPQAARPAKPPELQVWDLFVRVFHWSLVAVFALAYVSSEGPRRLHEWLGYAALGLVLARVLWGFVGSRHARFADFVPSPRRLRVYVAQALKRQEPRHLGHNPAAAVMIVFLMLMVTAIGVSGWMMSLDAFWGNETLEEAHELLVHITMAAVAVHVLAAFYESWRHRENLIGAMVTGRKRGPD
jgi:cytochrome b